MSRELDIAHLKLKEKEILDPLLKELDSGEDAIFNLVDPILRIGRLSLLITKLNDSLKKADYSLREYLNKKLYVAIFSLYSERAYDLNNDIEIFAEKIFNIGYKKWLDAVTAAKKDGKDFDKDVKPGLIKEVILFCTKELPIKQIAEIVFNDGVKNIAGNPLAQKIRAAYWDKFLLPEFLAAADRDKTKIDNQETDFYFNSDVINKILDNFYKDYKNNRESIPRERYFNVLNLISKVSYNLQANLWEEDLRVNEIQAFALERGFIVIKNKEDSLLECSLETNTRLCREHIDALILQRAKEKGNKLTFLEISEEISKYTQNLSIEDTICLQSIVLETIHFLTEEREKIIRTTECISEHLKKRPYRNDYADGLWVQQFRRILEEQEFYSRVNKLHSFLDRAKTDILFSEVQLLEILNDFFEKLPKDLKKTKELEQIIKENSDQIKKVNSSRLSKRLAIEECERKCFKKNATLEDTGLILKALGDLAEEELRNIDSDSTPFLLDRLRLCSEAIEILEFISRIANQNKATLLHQKKIFYEEASFQVQNIFSIIYSLSQKGFFCEEEFILLSSSKDSFYNQYSQKIASSLRVFIDGLNLEELVNEGQKKTNKTKAEKDKNNNIAILNAIKEILLNLDHALTDDGSLGLFFFEYSDLLDSINKKRVEVENRIEILDPNKKVEETAEDLVKREAIERKLLLEEEIELEKKQDILDKEKEKLNQQQEKLNARRQELIDKKIKLEEELEKQFSSEDDSSKPGDISFINGNVILIQEEVGTNIILELQTILNKKDEVRENLQIEKIEAALTKIKESAYKPRVKVKAVVDVIYKYNEYLQNILSPDRGLKELKLVKLIYEKIKEHICFTEIKNYTCLIKNNIRDDLNNIQENLENCIDYLVCEKQLEKIRLQKLLSKKVSTEPRRQAPKQESPVRLVSLDVFSQMRANIGFSPQSQQRVIFGAEDYNPDLHEREKQKTTQGLSGAKTERRIERRIARYGNNVHSKIGNIDSDIKELNAVKIEIRRIMGIIFDPSDKSHSEAAANNTNNAAAAGAGVRSKEENSLNKPPVDLENAKAQPHAAAATSLG